MSEGVSVSPKSVTRLWAFAGTALLLAPLSSYFFGLVIQRPILFGFPVVAAVLLAISVLFGLWSPTYGIAAKVGVVLWSAVLAWMAPIILVVVFDFYCGLLNSRAGHYVCGL